jgi:transcriptional regulator with XRE-family HTH domain
MTETHIGTRIRELRRARKLTQHQLAQQLGIPVRTLRTYEKNKCVPDVVTLQQIATALDFPVNDFWRGEPAPKTPVMFVCRLDEIFGSSNDW